METVAVVRLEGEEAWEDENLNVKLGVLWYNNWCVMRTVISMDNGNVMICKLGNKFI